MFFMLSTSQDYLKHIITVLCFFNQITWRIWTRGAISQWLSPQVASCGSPNQAKSTRVWRTVCTALRAVLVPAGPDWARKTDHLRAVIKPFYCFICCKSLLMASSCDGNVITITF